MSNWTIFSNHGHVLVCLTRDPEARLRDVAADVGLTERAVQKIVHDLHASGMVSIRKYGRRNHYRIDTKKTLRHRLEAHCTLGALVNLIINESGTETRPAAPQPPDTKVSATVPAPLENKAVEKAPAKPTKETPATSDLPEKQQGSLF